MSRSAVMMLLVPTLPLSATVSIRALPPPGPPRRHPHRHRGRGVVLLGVHCRAMVSNPRARVLPSRGPSTDVFILIPSVFHQSSIPTSITDRHECGILNHFISFQCGIFSTPFFIILNSVQIMSFSGLSPDHPSFQVR